MTATITFENPFIGLVMTAVDNVPPTCETCGRPCSQGSNICPECWATDLEQTEAFDN